MYANSQMAPVSPGGGDDQVTSAVGAASGGGGVVVPTVTVGGGQVMNGAGAGGGTAVPMAIQKESQIGGDNWQVLGVPVAPPDDATHDEWAAYCVEWYRQFPHPMMSVFSHRPGL